MNCKSIENPIDKGSVAKGDSIHDQIKQLLINYEKETGIAITYVSMKWIETMDGGFIPVKIKLEAQSF